MRVAYLYVDFGHEVNAEQRRLAAISIASVRKHMPGVEIVHLADLKTKTLDGVDSVLAAAWDGPLCVPTHNNRGDLQAQLHGDVLFLDTDTILTQDVSGVFDDKEFEVAVAKRPDDWEGAEFNQGVVFSRNEKFWKAVAEKARERKIYDEAGFTDVVLNGGFRVKQLSETYNFAIPPDTAILHFKGQRKRVMLGL